MVVLLTGAGGFIGRHLAEALTARGHEVICGVRNGTAADAHRPPFRYMEIDFSHDTDPAGWRDRLDGVEAVINAVGILRETDRQTFAAVHSRAPRALFAACAEAGIRRVIQISALGADEQAASRYHRSKKEADDFLLGLPLAAVVVQPSLVYGAGGASARLFTALASLPLIPLPGQGEQVIQPIALEDLVAAVVALLETDRGGRIPLVGPQAVTLRAFLTRLRRALGLGRPRFLPLPMVLVRFGAKLAPVLPGSLLDSDTLRMLVRGNCGEVEPTRRLLGREPRPIEAWIPAEQAPAARVLGKLRWLLPLLRLGIALVWIVTGIVSLGIYPVAESYALLARVGIGGWAAPVLLYGAAGLDLVLGAATLIIRRRRLWLVQIGVILVYSGVITWWLPEFWLHPYGPVLKNVPLLMALWMLYELDER